MHSLLLVTLGPILLTVGALTPPPVRALKEAPALQDVAPTGHPLPERLRYRGQRYVKTELYFGTTMPGTTVSEERFLAFVDTHVTPRFPDGLTLLKGYGHFTGRDGVLTKEASFALILLYPFDTLKDSHKKIEVIRYLYKREFQQESVLRVDGPYTVRVSF